MVTCLLCWLLSEARDEEPKVLHFNEAKSYSSREIDLTIVKRESRVKWHIRSSQFDDETKSDTHPSFDDDITRLYCTVRS